MAYQYDPNQQPMPDYGQQQQPGVGYPPPQGYPPRPGYGTPPEYGQQPEYPPQPAYPPQPGYPPQSGSGQQPGYPPQPAYPPQPGYGPPSGYPPQPGYGPQSGYGQQTNYPPQSPYPPAQYAAQQPGRPYGAPQVRPRARNPLARTALIYGAISLGVNIVGAILGFYLIGLLAVYAIYTGIRALMLASRTPGNPGLGMAIGGLVMGVLSALISLAGLLIR
ncbi:MAG TPA: DUF4190 domain-containing protein [Ktedonobacterales bacterium]|jgi:hypothetical protein|nr:DUF4190 domain-containing protein [Ktedonobacterales bacterium]